MEEIPNVVFNKDDDPLIGISYSALVKKRGKPDTVTPMNDGSGRKMQYCWLIYTPSCFYDKNGDKKMDAYDSDRGIF
ncbi:MAG: hypothetical protein CR972_02775 [Candidatus Moraniibacteriota bacterium]|nr:MAG: hypothetical protein CR972_02775 [Candidatus Moranbacteria bacterium]